MLETWKMNSRALRQIFKRPENLFLVVLMALCLLLAAGGIESAFEKREALFKQGGARKVDLVKVRKQMSDGFLSGKKAMFYKKVRDR